MATEPGQTEMYEHIRDLHDRELADFIRDTVARLNAVADRLEVYATEVEVPQVPFETSSNLHDVRRAGQPPLHG